MNSFKLNFFFRLSFPTELLQNPLFHSRFLQCTMQEIPVPAFMLEKAEDKWSEEEKKAAADYKMQLKTQEEEREKYKKVEQEKEEEEEEEE